MFVLICTFWVWTSFTTVELHARADGIYETRAICEANIPAFDETDESARYYCAETPKTDP